MPFALVQTSALAQHPTICVEMRQKIGSPVAFRAASELFTITVETNDRLRDLHISSHLDLNLIYSYQAYCDPFHTRRTPFRSCRARDDTYILPEPPLETAASPPTDDHHMSNAPDRVDAALV